MPRTQRRASTKSNAKKKSMVVEPIVPKLSKEKKQKFVAQIAQVHPKKVHPKLGLLKKGFVRIVLGSENFDGERLAASAEWIRSNLDNCTILVGDSMHRLTLQIQQGLVERDSWNKAYRMGKEFLETHGNYFQNDGLCKFEVMYTSDVKKFTSYKRLYDELMIQFTKDSEFEKAIKHCAFLFLQRQDQIENTIYIPGSKNNAVHLCCQYLLEELAAFGWMVENHHGMLVYPGIRPIMDEVSEERFPHLPDTLKRLVSVQLELKAKGFKKRLIVR